MKIELYFFFLKLLSLGVKNPQSNIYILGYINTQSNKLPKPNRHLFCLVGRVERYSLLSYQKLINGQKFCLVGESGVVVVNKHSIVSVPSFMGIN